MDSKPNQSLFETLHCFITAVDQEYPVRFAYLFGSQARGHAGVSSDIDIAIYFINQYDREESAFIRGFLIESGKKYFKNPIDLILLNQADLNLKYIVVKEGIPIKESPDNSRSDFESLTLREYFDFQYYSDIYNNSIIESIKKQDYFGENHG